MVASELERTFETYWRQLGGLDLESEYKFHATRKWRFDFAHIGSRVAIELEGGTWDKGRHTRPAGYAADCEKYNAATLEYWSIFRLTSDMLNSDPAGHLEPIIRFIADLPQVLDEK